MHAVSAALILFFIASTPIVKSCKTATSSSGSSSGATTGSGSGATTASSSNVDPDSSHHRKWAVSGQGAGVIDPDSTYKFDGTGETDLGSFTAIGVLKENDEIVFEGTVTGSFDVSTGDFKATNGDDWSFTGNAAINDELTIIEGTATAVQDLDEVASGSFKMLVNAQPEA